MSRAGRSYSNSQCTCSTGVWLLFVLQVLTTMLLPQRPQRLLFVLQVPRDLWLPKEAGRLH